MLLLQYAIRYLRIFLGLGLHSLLNNKYQKIENKSNPKKKLLWILYDALDPEFLEKKINDKYVYENLIKLKNTGIYFQVNDLGSFIISELSEFISLNSLQNKIMKNFDVTASECESDLLKFIEALEEKNLLHFQ